MCLEAPDALILWGDRVWSKSLQAFYDKAPEGGCWLKKEGQVLLRSAKPQAPPIPHQEDFFSIYFIKSVKGHVFSMKYLQESPSCGFLRTCLGAAPAFCFFDFFFKTLLLISDLSLPTRSFWCCPLFQHLSQTRSLALSSLEFLSKWGSCIYLLTDNLLLNHHLFIRPKRPRPRSDGALGCWEHSWLMFSLKKDFFCHPHCKKASLLLCL